MIVVLLVRIDARAARARVFDRRRRVGGERILGAGEPARRRDGKLPSRAASAGMLGREESEELRKG
jgi:hypothetical protein